MQLLTRILPAFHPPTYSMDDLCQLQSDWSVLWSPLGLAIKPLVLSPSWDHPDLSGPVCRAEHLYFSKLPFLLCKGQLTRLYPSRFQTEVPSILCDQDQSIYFAESGCLINVFWPNAGFLLFSFFLQSYLVMEFKNTIKIMAHASCSINVSWMIKNSFLLGWILGEGAAIWEDAWECRSSTEVNEMTVHGRVLWSIRNMWNNNDVTPSKYERQ